MKLFFVIPVILLALGLPAWAEKHPSSDKEKSRPPPKEEAEAETSAAADDETKAVDKKQKGIIKVSVTGLKNDKGNVLVNLFNDADGFPGNHKKACRTAIVPTKKLAVIEFKHLPAGQYAVSVCHDENASLKLETGLFGRPKEGVGISNKVISRLRAPTFAEASFSLDSSAREITVKVTY